jgi:hypothetical protein
MVCGWRIYSKNKIFLMSISLNIPRRQLLGNLTVLIVLLFTLALASCSTEIKETSTPKSFYSDQEVEAFIDQFPSLVTEFGEGQPPEDILERLKIDITALKVVDRYVGGCLDFIVYDLSPNYELVVDNNFCSGFRVYIRDK